MEALSIPHLLIILVIVLVFFGGRRIPEVMKGLGQGIHEFKEGMRGDAQWPAYPDCASGKHSRPLRQHRRRPNRRFSAGRIFRCRGPVVSERAADWLPFFSSECRSVFLFFLFHARND